jgi:NhaP-type Na+/H+ or K+/H+ antiporter
MKNRETWIGLVGGGVLGAVAWYAFLQLQAELDEPQGLADFLTGLWVILTLSGDAPWLGYAMGVVAGALIGFVGMRNSRTRTQAQQEMATAAAARPHPMD